MDDAIEACFDLKRRSDGAGERSAMVGREAKRNPRRRGEAIDIVRNPFARYRIHIDDMRGMHGMEIPQWQKKMTAPMPRFAVIF